MSKTNLYNAVEPYFPSDEEVAYSLEVYSQFQYCQSLRDQSYPEFDDLTPTQYWEEARKRAKNYLPPLPASQELTNMFVGKTRNKRNAIAAFVAAQRPRVEISVRGGKNTKKSDKRLSMMMKTAYDFFMDKENADLKYLDWVIETMDVGTGYMQVGWDFREREVKTEIERDFATGETKWKKEHRVYRDQPLSTIIRIEDVYFPDLYQQDIQEQPYVIIREYVPRVVAEQWYGKNKKWKYVPISNMGVTDEKEGDTYFFRVLQGRVEDNYVEILHKIDKWNDVYTRHVNGILIDPVDNPLPMDHKEVPIAQNFYEKIGSFAYGMAFGMKFWSEQDSLNELANSNMDRARISSIPKAISDYETEIEQDYIGTFQVLKSNQKDGLREFSFDSVKPGDVQFMELLAQMIDESTVSSSFNGDIKGVTSTEIMNAQRQNQQNLGTFLTYIYNAAKTHSELLLSTILQYYFVPSKKYAGKDFETKEIVFEQKLQDGIDGVRVIRVVSSKGKIPRKSDQLTEHERGIAKKRDQVGREVRKVETNYDYIYITPEEIADAEYKIKIIPNSSLPEIQSLKKALAIEFSNAMAQPQYAGMTDFSKIQEIIIESFGYAVDDVRPEEADAQQQGMAQENAMQQQMAGQAGAQSGGGQSSPMGNSELVQQMAGTSKAGLQQLMTPS